MSSRDGRCLSNGASMGVPLLDRNHDDDLFAFSQAAGPGAMPRGRSNRPSSDVTS